MSAKKSNKSRSTSSRSAKKDITFDCVNMGADNVNRTQATCMKCIKTSPTQHSRCVNLADFFTAFSKKAVGKVKNVISRTKGVSAYVVLALLTVGQASVKGLMAKFPDISEGYAKSIINTKIRPVAIACQNILTAQTIYAKVIRCLVCEQKINFKASTPMITTAARYYQHFISPENVLALQQQKAA